MRFEFRCGEFGGKDDLDRRCDRARSSARRKWSRNFDDINSRYEETKNRIRTCPDRVEILRTTMCIGVGQGISTIVRLT